MLKQNGQKKTGIRRFSLSLDWAYIRIFVVAFLISPWYFATVVFVILQELQPWLIQLVEGIQLLRDLHFFPSSVAWEFTFLDSARGICSSRHTVMMLLELAEAKFKM